MPVLKINNHDMYYEIHGEGPPLVCTGGWGTFCHGEHQHIPWGLTDEYQVILFDHRGLEQSSDDLSVKPSIKMYADDVAGLLDALKLTNVHMVGMVGMGACIAQELAIDRPDLVRSMVNTGSWVKVDRMLADQFELFRAVHEEMGFLEFQKLVSIMSFEPEYYARTIDRLLGPKGVWHHLNGNYQAHERFLTACLDHDAVDRLHLIEAPSLIVHAALDMVTGPRTTLPIEQGIRGAEGIMMGKAAHVIAGKELKGELSRHLLSFLARN